MKETTTFDETLINFIERKHPRKGEKKETRGKEDRRSPGKQTAQQRWATRRKGNH
jgi:hypothetical protein